MFTLSAFADEISPNPLEQIQVLKTCAIRYIEFRSIYSTNVLALSDQQIAEFKKVLDDHGIGISAIGSPIGKIKIDDPFEPHQAKFLRAIELCKVFNTRNIRIFSYYPPDNFDGNWEPWRSAVFDRLNDHVAVAAKHNVQLFHENEHRIYGDSPERLADLYANIQSPHFKAAFDPANFVFCGYDPIAGWEASKAHMAHFHVKDWATGAPHGSIPGEGEGQFPRIVSEAVAMGYSGFATMEPHLLGGGPTGGMTGPELFPKAVAAFRKIVEQAGGSHQ
ncbi:MAG: sugar phosphate isomerase/epimerase family protein [Zavarzinella sp.]